MPYQPPKDPRPAWEWCPRCEAWYEVGGDEYGRRPTLRDWGCTHIGERRLTAEEVYAASRPAGEIYANAERLAEVEDMGYRAKERD